MIDVVREAILKRVAGPRERIELVFVMTLRDLYFFAVMPCVVYSTIKKLLRPLTMVWEYAKVRLTFGNGNNLVTFTILRRFLQ